MISEFLAEILTNRVTIAYDEIPNFPPPKDKCSCNAGHVVFGRVGDVSVIFFTRILQYCDGYTLQQCVMPVRILKLLGVPTLVIASTGECINQCLVVGDIVLIKDHINLMGMAGHNPLRGRNEDRFGPRFLAMNNAYDTSMVQKVKDLLRESDLENKVFDGVYACSSGPSSTTLSEVKMLDALGVDVIGKSVVHEVITAKHCGMKVFAFALITRTCDFEENVETPDTHEQVVKQQAEILQKFLESFIGGKPKKVAESGSKKGKSCKCEKK